MRQSTPLWSASIGSLLQPHGWTAGMSYEAACQALTNIYVDGSREAIVMPVSAVKTVRLTRLLLDRLLK